MFKHFFLTCCIFFLLTGSVWAASTVTEVRNDIQSVQANLPPSIPTPLSSYEPKWYVGEIISNIFDGTQYIKSDFISAFRSIFNLSVNNVPKWNGQSFLASNVWSIGTGVWIGTSTISSWLTLDVEWKIWATEYCDADGNNCFQAYSFPAQWYQTDNQECSTFCDSRGLTNIPDNTLYNASCTSWENAFSALSWIINYTYGTWWGYQTSATSSVGGQCYRPGQPQDSDGTDITTGCFCSGGIQVWSNQVSWWGGSQIPNSYGGKGEPDYELILNTWSQTTQWVCQHDIDLTDICGDGDGCSYRLLMNHKVHTNDITRNIDGDIYFEDPLFSKNNGTWIYGHTRQSWGGDYVFINGTGTRTEHMFSPWGWVYFSNHKNAYCSGISVNTPYLASEPFKFSFMTHPNIQTKLLFWD